MITTLCIFTAINFGLIVVVIIGVDSNLKKISQAQIKQHNINLKLINELMILTKRMSGKGD